jgi:hypothetical protein
MSPKKVNSDAYQNLKMDNWILGFTSNTYNVYVNCNSNCQHVRILNHTDGSVHHIPIDSLSPRMKDAIKVLHSFGSDADKPT